jgi:hypothetical protein
MGTRRLASPSSRHAKKTRRTSPPRFADDHLEGRQSPRSSRVNCSRLALPRRFVVAAAVSAATTGERTSLACWFRRLAETNLNPTEPAKPASETAVIFPFFGIGE